MADVSKIKFPNNSEVNIKDYRIPGVDDTPTSGSDNVVTSDGIYNALREDNPLYTKTYTYKCAAATEAEAYIYFMNITPTSSEWATPWTVHYTLTVDCDTSEDANAKYCHGDYDVFIGCAGSNYYYHIFNKFYSSSYYPIYYHKLIYHNSEAKYNSYRESHPAKAGVRVLSAWGANTRTRTYTIKVYDYKNCTISFPDNIENHTTAYNNTYNNVVDLNATSTGLQETGDANTANYYNYEYYVGYRIHSSETPLYRYKFVGFDNRNRIVPINITNQTNSTIINKTACSVPMTVSNGLALYNTTTIIDNDTTVIATGTLYRDTSIISGILQYNLSESVGRTSNSTVSQEVYLVGTYDIKTDEFTLDDSSYTSFYKVVPILQSESDYFASFTTGKYYWYLGQCPVNDNVFNFTPPHPVFYFNGTKLIEVHSQEFKNISDQLFVYAQSLNDLNTNKENLSNKVTSISNASTNTEYPSAAAVVGYVTNCVDTALASALQYKGTVASNSNLPATHKVGWVYVVSTAGTFAGKSCEVGDYIICKTAGTSANNAHWDVINGENQVENKSASLAAAGSSATIATVDGTDITVTTPSTWTGLAKTGTVTSVTINATSPIAIDSSAAITASGTRTISHANSGVTAGTYKSVTVDVKGHVTAGTNPTTVAGYGITDAVTSIGTSGNTLTWAKAGVAQTAITVPYATNADTVDNKHAADFALAEYTYGTIGNFVNGVGASNYIARGDLGLVGFDNTKSTIELYEAASGGNYPSSPTKTINMSDATYGSDFIKGNVRTMHTCASGSKLKIVLKTSSGYIKAAGLWISARGNTISYTSTIGSVTKSSTLSTYGSWHIISCMAENPSTITIELNTTNVAIDLEFAGVRTYLTNPSNLRFPGIANSVAWADVDGKPNFDSTYVKIDPGTVEQTIKSHISTLDKGVINLYRDTGDHYTFLGFSNGSTEKYLGGIGFKSQADHELYLKAASSINTPSTNYYKIWNENNHPAPGVTAGTAGSSSASSGSTLSVPYVTVNASGHVTGYGTHTHTISGFSTTDTKNTAGSTDTSSKIFLVGATSQAANPQTYSDNEVYATSGVLTTKSVQVGVGSATMQYNSTDQSIEFIFE